MGWAQAVESPVMGTGDESLERAIAGALRAAINDHGPITVDKIGSAAKRVAGNLRNARLAGLAVALGRRGGLARKESGANFERMGRKGGRAGRGVPKPRSEEARRRMLARRVLRATGPDGQVLVAKVIKLAPDRPELHAARPAREIAEALGVVREFDDLAKARR